MNSREEQLRKPHLQHRPRSPLLSAAARPALPAPRHVSTAAASRQQARGACGRLHPRHTAPPGPRRPWLAVLGRRPTLPGHGFAEAAARVVKASDVAWLRGAQGVLHVGSWKTEQEVGDLGCRQCGHCHCRTFRPDRPQPRESAGAPPLADSPAPRPPRHAR